MNRFPIVVAVFLVLVGVSAWAAEPLAEPSPFQGGPSAAEVTPTPEMWFYEQYQREYQDPNTAVRRKAEFRTVQRRNRLATRRWFGLSNLRPRAAIDPVHTDYSPGWSSNFAARPYRWAGVGRPWILVRPETPGLRVY